MEIKVKYQRTGRNFLLLGFLVAFLPNLSFYGEFVSCNTDVLRRYGDLKEGFGCWCICWKCRITASGGRFVVVSAMQFQMPVYSVIVEQKGQRERRAC